MEPGEVAVELDIDGRSVGVEREDTEAIREPFDPEKIDVVTRNQTVDLLLSRVKRNVLDLQLEFQRLAGIWPPLRQSRLIESMLLRIPLPTFYAAESIEVGDRWVIVDGIQRLTAIARFVAPDSIGLGRLVLTDLEYLKDYEGKGFDGQPGRLQTRLLETEVVLHLIRRWKTKVTGESETRKSLCEFLDLDGAISIFELHARFTPGPGRIHFRLIPGDGIARVAYIGRKRGA
jgi:hypothetical protein